MNRSEFKNVLVKHDGCKVMKDWIKVYTPDDEIEHYIRASEIILVSRKWFRTVITLNQSSDDLYIEDNIEETMKLIAEASGNKSVEETKMTDWIKVHIPDSDGKYYYIRASEITNVYRGEDWTIIALKHMEDELCAEESPEEVMKLIEDAEIPRDEI